MKLLLDTHIWLWALIEPDRLSRPVRRRLEAAGTETWLSPISVWEAALLAERGRIELDRPVAEWIRHQLVAAPMRDAPLTREVALQSRAVTIPHEDPADRFLAATAAVHKLTLVTADERLWDGAGYDVLRNA